MLGKLLKYDLKWIYKVIIVFYCLALIFSAISRICLNIENSTLFQIVGQFSGRICNCNANKLPNKWSNKVMGKIYKEHV